MSTEANGTEGQSGRPKKYLIFLIGQDRFAVPLAEVKEVVGLTTITPIPDMPDYFRGLINLRGRIVSVFDVRTKIKVPRKGEPVKRPCIIIAELSGVVLGALVDDVQEVSAVLDTDIVRKLEISSEAAREYVVGAIRTEGRPLTLLIKLSKVLEVGEIQRAHAAAESAVAAATAVVTQSPAAAP